MVAARSPGAGWRVLAASTRGASHLRSGAPNQDAVASWVASGGLPAIAAVADGHGAALHFRSELGARFGVESAVATLRALASGASPGVAAALTTPLPEQMVADWRRRVLAHFASAPFSADELAEVASAHGERGVSDVHADPALAYGATLLAAVVTPTDLLLLQLGDGDVLAIGSDGATHRPLPGDARLHANLTTSLCQPDAALAFRLAHIDLRLAAPPAIVMLTTDGYANSFASDGDFLKAGRDFLALLRQEGPEQLAADLPGFLGEASEKGSGDDVTLALLYTTAVTARSESPVAAARSELTWEAAARTPEPSTGQEQAQMPAARRGLPDRFVRPTAQGPGEPRSHGHPDGARKAEPKQSLRRNAVLLGAIACAVAFIVLAFRFGAAPPESRVVSSPSKAPGEERVVPPPIAREREILGQPGPVPPARSAPVPGTRGEPVVVPDPPAGSGQSGPMAPVEQSGRPLPAPAPADDQGAVAGFNDGKKAKGGATPPPKDRHRPMI